MSEFVEAQFYIWLEAVTKEDRPVVGDRAFSLSQLQQQSPFKTLPGLVIPGGICRQFLGKLGDETPVLADFPQSVLHVPASDPQALQSISQQCRRAIMQTALPPQWLEAWISAIARWDFPTLIMRPSLGLPHGQKSHNCDLFLPKICWSDIESVKQRVKESWAELFSARSLFYWQKMGIELNSLNFALLIQPCLNAIASGKAEIKKDSLTIEAIHGLGYCLSPGEILANQYQSHLSSSDKPQKAQIGYQSRAIRLTPPPNHSSVKQDCLETVWLSRELSQAAALNDADQMTLLNIGRQLNEQSLAPCTFEWWLLAEAESSEKAESNELLITDFHSTFPTITPLLNRHSSSSSNSSAALLSGICASPGSSIALVEVISEAEESLSHLPDNCIWLAREIPFSWLPWLKTAAGIIVENSGTTSHAAILARELGIPAIVGALGAIEQLSTGDCVRLDATQGSVYRHHSPSSVSTLSPLPQANAYQHSLKTQLMVNLSQPESIASAVSLPVSGVGLLRAELLMLELFANRPLEQWLSHGDESALIDNMADLVSQFTQAFSPRPIFYRSLNQKPGCLSSDRGISYYLTDSSLFDLELQALAQVQARGGENLRLILPLVRSVEEFIFCDQLVTEAGLKQFSEFQLWMMAEVPSALFLLSEYVAAGVQGIAIGTNDLTQYLLGLERDELSLAELSASHRSALLSSIEQFVMLADQLGIPCSLCGQFPIYYPQTIQAFVEWGLSAISVDPEAISEIYQAIAAAESSQH